MLEGVIAEFTDEHALARAAARMRYLGYRELDAHTPFPSDEVLAALAVPPSRLARFALAGGGLGIAVGYFVLWWTNTQDYPLDVGGRDPYPWPAFVPITFETAVLFAALTAFFGFFLLCGLPRLWHPVFEVPGFERASDDGFFLTIGAADPHFDLPRTMGELNECSPLRVARFGEVRS